MKDGKIKHKALGSVMYDCVAVQQKEKLTNPGKNQEEEKKILTVAGSMVQSDHY